jgi:murein DD-endopeptidase MepM/ murein hydrolase activator NlpD
MSARSFLFALVILALAGGGYFALSRYEGNAPEIITASSLPPVGKSGIVLSIQLQDQQSGLRGVSVVLTQSDTNALLHDEGFPTSILDGSPKKEHTLEIPIDPAALKLVSGEAMLTILVDDASWRRAFAGNRQELKIPMVFDFDPPRVRAMSGLTYVFQGGSSAVRYQVEEAVERHGVQVGETFYAGGPLPGGSDKDRVAFFAVPITESAKVKIQVVAVDAAGNTGAASWPVRVRAKPPTPTTITLPASFLNGKVPELAAQIGVSESDAVATFQKINTEIRAENEARIRSKLVFSPTPLWEGAFRQWPGSQVMSKYGEHRRYRVNGEQVSEALHLGYDLAATAAASVPASNRGKVVFAGDMGIYGNCVLIDHGLGVTSLYGHLSRVDVAAGDSVEQGDSVGLSGATGLAGGDHLHFGLLVGDTYVNPLEWWDRSWIKNNILSQLNPEP